jgi:thiol:disulfide interchange protein
LAKDWHFYADGQMALKITPQAKGVMFDKPIPPPAHSYYDKAFKKNLNVFSETFTFYIPFELVWVAGSSKFPVILTVEGAMCSNELCKIFKPDPLKTEIILSDGETAPVAKFQLPKVINTADDGQERSYSAPAAFLLAIAAGLLLNVMPCVWPIIPIIIMRLWDQAGQKRGKSISLGFAFCIGILLFFAAIAIFNIVLAIGFDTAFQWGDQLRNPVFVMAMTILMVVLALFMFGLFTIGIPSSVTGAAASGSGFAGSIGMGFLAALLATPCSFAVLTATLAWAQTKPLVVATTTIMLIGIGMAFPYLILVSIPGLANRLPRPGGWMERIKQAMGFLLLIVAVKLISALSGEIKMAVLYYIVVLSFCIWIAGSWVTYSTAKTKKLLVRFIALIIAVVAGFTLLGGTQEMIEWQDYDSDAVSQAVEAKQPVLIKFTAAWCANCTIVDRLVYKRSDIAELIAQKGVITFKADTTAADFPATIDLVNKYNEPGTLPVTILLFPDLPEKKLRGIIKKDDLKKILQTLPNTKE